MSLYTVNRSRIHVVNRVVHNNRIRVICRTRSDGSSTQLSYSIDTSQFLGRWKNIQSIETIWKNLIMQRVILQTTLVCVGLKRSREQHADPNRRAGRTAAGTQEIGAKRRGAKGRSRRRRCPGVLSRHQHLRRCVRWCRAPLRRGQSRSKCCFHPL